MRIEISISVWYNYHNERVIPAHKGWLKMRERLKNAIIAWEEKVSLRNAYVYGNEDVSLTEFAGLFKETFEIIKTAKNKYIYKKAVPEDEKVSFEYLRLLTVMSKYVPFGGPQDESKNNAYTATALITEKLIEYTTCVYGYMYIDGVVTCVDDDSNHQGTFFFIREDYPYESGIEEREKGRYSYNVYDGNFDEVLELASQIDIAAF